MKIKFWGVRGSCPAPGPTTERFGGNTSCISVDLGSGPLLVLDAGTGIRSLGKELMQQGDARPVVLLITHGHWDHIQGFPFFAPAYRSTSRIQVMGGFCVTRGLQELLEDVMEGAHFPIPLGGLSADISFEALPEGWHQVGDARVLTVPTCHPGGCCGFRIEVGDQVVVYLTDNELPADQADWDPFIETARDAGILIHDAQYTAEELPRYFGWGHSSVDQAVNLALAANVHTLYLFHHDPDRGDADLRGMEKHARSLVRRAGGSLQVHAAAESSTIVEVPVVMKAAAPTRSPDRKPAGSSAAVCVAAAPALSIR